MYREGWLRNPAGRGVAKNFRQSRLDGFTLKQRNVHQRRISAIWQAHSNPLRPLLRKGHHFRNEAEASWRSHRLFASRRARGMHAALVDTSTPDAGLARGTAQASGGRPAAFFVARPEVGQRRIHRRVLVGACSCRRLRPSTSKRGGAVEQKIKHKENLPHQATPLPTSQAFEHHRWHRSSWPPTARAHAPRLAA